MTRLMRSLFVILMVALWSQSAVAQDQSQSTGACRVSGRQRIFIAPDGPTMLTVAVDGESTITLGQGRRGTATASVNGEVSFTGAVRRGGVFVQSNNDIESGLISLRGVWNANQNAQGGIELSSSELTLRGLRLRCEDLSLSRPASSNDAEQWTRPDGWIRRGRVRFFSAPLTRGGVEVEILAPLVGVSVVERRGHWSHVHWRTLNGTIIDGWTTTHIQRQDPPTGYSLGSGGFCARRPGQYGEAMVRAGAAIYESPTGAQWATASPKSSWEISRVDDDWSHISEIPKVDIFRPGDCPERGAWVRTSDVDFGVIQRGELRVRVNENTAIIEQLPSNMDSQLRIGDQLVALFHLRGAMPVQRIDSLELANVLMKCPRLRWRIQRAGQMADVRVALPASSQPWPECPGALRHFPESMNELAAFHETPAAPAPITDAQRAMLDRLAFLDGCWQHYHIDAGFRVCFARRGDEWIGETRQLGPMADEGVGALRIHAHGESIAITTDTDERHYPYAEKAALISLDASHATFGTDLNAPAFEIGVEGDVLHVNNGSLRRFNPQTRAR